MLLFLDIRTRFTILLLLSCCTVLGQHYRFTNYTAVEGLSQNGVYSLLEDSRGNIWMGTRGGGLNQFTGLNFIPFTTFDGLSDNGILCLYEDSKGVLWIGTDNGLNSYDGHNFKSYSCSVDPDQPFVISGIIENKENELLIASTKGLFRLNGDSLINLELKINFDYISFLERDKAGDVWLGVNNELIRLRPDEIDRFNRHQGLGNNRIAAASFLNDGRIVVACYADGLYIFDNGKFTKFLYNKDILAEYVNVLFADTKNQLWIGTNNSGIYKVDLISSNFELLNASDGLANDHVESIMEDSWGNIWIGTGGSGVSKYHRAAFSQITERNGIPGNWIYSVVKDSSNRMWVGSGTRGVTVFTDSTIKTYDSYSGFITSKVRLMFEDRRHRIWLAPEGGGLWVYDSVFSRVYSDRTNVPFDHIKAITQDNSGKFWICEGGKGILAFEYIDSSRTIHSTDHITSAHGLPRNYVYALHCDQLDRIWFGTNNRGGGYIYNGKVVPITSRDGLAGNSVVMIDEDEDGFVWLAGGDGITRVTAFKQPVEFQKIGREDGIIGNPVYQVYCDTSGYLWVGTAKGVTRFIRENGLLSNPRHFGYFEGFTGLETNSNAVCAGAGKVYFGTGNGLMVYEGDNSNEKNNPPKISITDIKLFYESILNSSFAYAFGSWGQMNEELVLPHDKNNLGFEFMGISHVNPEKVTYSWILEGFDKNWTPALSKNDAAYSNLPPGTYVFKVKAANSEGVWSEAISTKKITISVPPPPPPPFWQKTWFITTVSAIGATIIFLIILILYLRIKRERERIKMERNLLELEQKALRLQMNPHFIFNALNSIQSLISVQDTKKARYQLAKFSKLMRQILDNSRSQFIALVDEVETLNNYLAIEQSCGGNDFDFEITTDPDLDPETVAVPPMMIQPFAENALIHGIRNMEVPGKVVITFSLVGKFVECSVDDNGIGRKKAASLKNQKGQMHKSTALVVTQERLDILIGKSGYKGMEVIDKSDDQGNAIGTRVIIRFPLMSVD